MMMFPVDVVSRIEETSVVPESFKQSVGECPILNIRIFHRRLSQVNLRGVLSSTDVQGLYDTE